MSVFKLLSCLKQQFLQESKDHDQGLNCNSAADNPSVHFSAYGSYSEQSVILYQEYMGLPLMLPTQ